MVEEKYARRSARVLLLDGADRLLLFRAPLDPVVDAPWAGGGHEHWWFTPGGGVDPGESLVAAAARELREETGLVVSPEELGDPVATAQGHVAFDWATGLFRDDFFFLRVETHDVDVSGFQTEESALILDHRWWTLPDLRAGDALVVPFGLVGLLEDLLAGRRPVVAVQLPWHHDQST